MNEPLTSHSRQTAQNTIERLLAPDPPPFAVLHRPHRSADTAEILIGDLIAVKLLADLPEPASAELPVLAVVPYRQIRERGFEAVDDGAELLALCSRERAVVALADLVALLPDGPHSFVETGYDVPDDEYERSVRAVLDQEIATGAGSNFVIHRSLTGRFADPGETPARAALGALKRLLIGERRAYWTFVVHTPESTFVGATPERHVSLDAGVARMNPISGTLRYPAAGWADADQHRRAMLAFLADPKERDELSMVVDEELKMMALVGDRGGRVRGPYLKEMAHLAHTEYLIEGETSFDAREVLAATMFAPTVTGSPIRNACRVIARHELRGRRYYAGVLALIGQDAAGRPNLDAPILIRTAEIAANRSVRVPAGATLVRGSRPAAELAETRAKAAAILASLSRDQAGGGARPATEPGPAPNQPRGRAADLSGPGSTTARDHARIPRFFVPERPPIVPITPMDENRREESGRRTGSRFGRDHARLAAWIGPSWPIVHDHGQGLGSEAKFSADHGGGLGGGLGVGRLAEDPEVGRLLADRNRTLARFWLQDQAELPDSASGPAASGGESGWLASGAKSGGKVVVIDAEDDFTGMLAHQLRSLGCAVVVRPWQIFDPADAETTAELAAADLVVLGPGPGDPRDFSDPRMLVLHGLAQTRLAASAPLLGICLGHQVMAHTLGLRVLRLPKPDQGRQRGIDLFGSAHRVGFYNSYVAQAPTGPMPGLTFSLDGAGERVNAVRGAALTGWQFHPESVLTTDGLDILAAELVRLIG